MAHELVPAPIAGMAEAIGKAAEFIAESQAGNTRRGYAADWRDFEAWCARYNKIAIPAAPADVAIYLSDLAGRAKVSTVRRRAAALAYFHRRAGHDNPVAHAGVKATISGIRRKLGSAPKKKAALTSDLVAQALRKVPTDLSGLRDRALIAIGFAAALRRSELVDLNVNDIERHPKGIVLEIRRSKTDQAGKGKFKAIPHGKKLRAPAALDAWLEAADISDGPIFRGVRGDTVLAAALCDRQVARIVKARASAIGLDADLFAGHSLRSGYITSADDAGAELASIAKHAGHAKLDTTLGYVQVADAFRDHSGRKFL